MPRRPVAGFVLVVALTAVWAGPVDARPRADELKAQRATLLEQIAVLSDTVEERHGELMVARHQQETAMGRLAQARARLRRRAVTAYIHLHALGEARRLRGGVYADVVADADRRVIDDYRAAREHAAGAERQAEEALAAARATQAQLEEARARLDSTIQHAEAVEARARRGAELRRKAAEQHARLASAPDHAPSYTAHQQRRHSDTTARQADLMARFPFGRVAGIPAGFAPTGQVIEGLASWYGPGFDGRPTASGAIYDQQGWTVASKELPLGTPLLITYNGRSVLALVNDRGPYVGARVLDLSHGVAQALGTVQAGVAWVRADVLTMPAS